MPNPVRDNKKSRQVPTGGGEGKKPCDHGLQKAAEGKKLSRFELKSESDDKKTKNKKQWLVNAGEYIVPWVCGEFWFLWSYATEWHTQGRIDLRVC